MRLSDLMSAANLTLFPQIALVMFVLLFAAALLYIFTRPRRHIDRMAQLPMDDRTDLAETVRHKESFRV